MKHKQTPSEIINEYLLCGGETLRCRKCYGNGLKQKSLCDSDRNNYFCDCKAGDILRKAGVCLLCLNTGWVEDLENTCGAYCKKQCECMGKE